MNFHVQLVIIFALTLQLRCVHLLEQTGPEGAVHTPEVKAAHVQNDSHDGGHHAISVVSWRFDYVREPLLLSLFILLAGVLKLVFHYVEWLSNVVPESCLLIIFGVAMGAIVNFSMEDASYIKLEPRMFILFLLPPIVLESAYSLNDRVFFNNIGTILLYAVIGTILNCFLIGPSLYGLSLGGAMGATKLSYLHCQLFASFIIAVDPVAVLAIFQEVGVNDVLYFLVFGESLLNDAVTIVLYNTMSTMSTMDVIEPSQIALAFASFFTVSLGGLTVGIIFGMLSALSTRTTSHVRIMEPLALFVFAFLSYLCAELLHWSGIVSLIGCGLIQAQYAFHNISRKSLITVKYFTKMISSTSDAIIFLFLGLEMIRIEHKWDTGFVMWSLLLCLIVRLIITCGLTKVANRFNRVKPISFHEQFIMWYGGLRGAVCFALCDTLPDDGNNMKNMFLTTTFAIIIFTVFVQGITIKPLVVFFKIKRKEEKQKLKMICEVQKHVTDHLMAGTQAIVGQYWRDYYIRQLIVQWNDKYFRHWFQTNPKTQDEQLLDTYQKIAIKAHVRHIIESTDDPTVTGLQEVGGPTTMAADEDDVFDVEHGRSIRTRKAKKNWSLMYTAVRGRGSSDPSDELVRDFRLAMAKKSSIHSMHHTFDRDLTRDEETDFESQFQEKQRRLRLNSTYRKNPISPADRLRRIGQSAARANRAKYQSLQPQTAIIEEDETDRGLNGNGSRPVLQMQFSDPGTQRSTSRDLLHDDDQTSESSNEVEV